MIAAATGAAAAALSVSPVHLRLLGAASRTIMITNAGDAAATVDARPAGIVFGKRGRPSIAPAGRAAGGWLRLRPRRFVVGPRTTVAVTVWSVVPKGAVPGDHPALVVLATRPSRAPGIAVRLRIGVVVFVRVAGRIVHRLELGAVRANGRVLEAAVANRGNVVELTRVRILLMRGRRVLARLRSTRRTLPPHSHGLVRLRCPVRVRGWVTAQVAAGRLRQTVRLRL